MRRPRAHAVVTLSLSVVLATGAAISACVFRSASDCDQNLGYGCGAGGSSTGTGGTSTTSNSTSSSGTGGNAPECTDASTCPQVVPPGPCASLGKATCTKGKCGITYTPGPAPSQQYGSCKTKMCDANGGTTDMADPTRVYDDGNPCTTEGCDNGMPSEMLLIGDACSVGGSTGFCVQDSTYAALVICSECLPPGQSTCTGGAVCAKGTCVPQHCTNGVKDLGETDIDCGGATSGCLKCAKDKACSIYQDCASQVCTAGKCAAPSCTDNQKNEDETDIDCGGSLCSPCGDTLHCAQPTDCKSGVCLPSGTPGMANTCAQPSCSDGVKNGDEEGTDCGGVMSACPPCGM